MSQATGSHINFSGTLAYLRHDAPLKPGPFAGVRRVGGCSHARRLTPSAYVSILSFRDAPMASPAFVASAGDDSRKLPRNRKTAFSSRRGGSIDGIPEVVWRAVTVAVLVKVFDGLVLATDSATTVSLSDGSAQVYNSADKIFHLHRELPIAAMTWGLGQVGPASVSTVAKDLRDRLMGQAGEDFKNWKVDKDTYTVEAVTKRLAEMFHDLLGQQASDLPDNCLGMLVAGYSANASQPEAWLLHLDGKGDVPDPKLVASPDGSGYIAFAQSRAADRLFRGYDNKLQEDVLNAVPSEHRGAVADALSEQPLSPVIPPMPFPDAIAFAKFLVEVTAGFSHFLLGPDTVGGPVEVAGVNRHEGLKWIARKHYYTQELNPG